MRGLRAHRGAVRGWLGFCVAAVTVAGCAPTPAPPSGGTAATFTYSCCRSADIDRVLHPGDVLVVHWIVSSGPPTGSETPLPVTLSASLTGAFTDAGQLKSTLSTSTPSPAASSSPVQTTDQAGGAPVSTIAIPADAAPGLYNLTTSVESGSGRLVGGSIVRVEPATAS